MRPRRKQTDAEPKRVVEANAEQSRMQSRVECRAESEKTTAERGAEQRREQMSDESSAETRAELRGKQNRGAKAQRCRGAKARKIFSAKQKGSRCLRCRSVDSSHFSLTQHQVEHTMKFYFVQRLHQDKFRYPFLSGFALIAAV